MSLHKLILILKYMWEQKVLSNQNNLAKEQSWKANIFQFLK